MIRNARMSREFDAEYLGFNNRTCSTKLSPRRTAGPVMRGPSKSMMWREWMIRVEDDNTKNEDYKTISLQAFIHPDNEDDARCLGFVSTFYGISDFKGTCVIPPYGNALFLNSSRDDSKDNSELWKIRQTDGATEQFELVASNKPDVCLQTLAVEDCSDQPSLIESSAPFTESRKYRSWKLVRRYDLSPKSSPLPPPPSPPPPSPVGPAPGPVISAPSSTTSGYVTLLVQSNGGNSGCSVWSITLTSVGAAVGSLPQTVEVSASMPGLNSVGVSVPLSQAGYNSIYAVGKCTNGGGTERSNALSVFYLASSGPAPTLIKWVLGNPGESCNQACTNNQVGACNVQPIRQVITQAEARYVASTVGLNSQTIAFTDCGGVQNLCGIPTIEPNFDGNQTRFNSVAGDCSSSLDGIQRFCCCGTTVQCPVS